MADDALFIIQKRTTPGEQANANLKTYWLESTAPTNVDPVPNEEKADPTNLLTVDDIATGIKNEINVNIVIHILGFNTTAADAASQFESAVRLISAKHKDTTSNPRKLVFIEYRWPSERMGSPGTSWVTAMPASLQVLFNISLAATVLFLMVTIGTIFLRTQSSIAASKLAFYTAWGLSGFSLLLLGLFIFILGLIVCFIILRIAVYFRDAYRASNYGVPDLVEFIRQLDVKIGPRADDMRIGLSFIAHSMGALVTTNVIRILSDVFAREAIGTSEVAAVDKKPGSHIGKAFSLKNLVLVSPDIPAEALISGRANFLSSSLRRFEEAYLFCNAGDIVVGVISALANYFSFPTMSNQYGYRLANVNIRKPSVMEKGIYRPQEFGVLNLEQTLRKDPLYAMKMIFAGKKSLYDLNTEITKSKFQNDESTISGMPTFFTYIDCTDYTENDMGQLTFAKKKADLTGWDNFWLLKDYLFKRKPDVHGGYFTDSAPLTQSMLYGFGCLGMQEGLRWPLQDSIASSSTQDDRLTELDKLCRVKGIQILLAGSVTHTDGCDKGLLDERIQLNPQDIIDKNLDKSIKN